MKRLFLLPLACVMLFGMVGCGDTHEDVMEDMIKTMEDFSATLKTIKDEESAKAAQPDLDALADRMKEIDERMDALDDLSDEEEEALDDKYKDRMTEALSDFLGEMIRVSMLGEDVRKILDEAMESMPSSLDDSDDE